MALDRSTLVAVIGAGAMGAGVAEVAAQAGHRVRLYDSATGAAERARAGIADRLRRAIENGQRTEEEAAGLIARVEPVATLDALKECGLVIEAIVEDLDEKRTLFRTLEPLVSPDAVLATNTSSLSVTAIAGALDRPERCLGLHFFNPAPLMALVEVVSGLATPESLAAEAMSLMGAWGKQPVRCRSTPGFIVNRTARPYYGEAVRMLEEGVADPATIDALLTGAGGFRMGPFALMDLVGLDVNLAANDGVWRGLGFDPRYAPTVIQREMVASGRLGRKSGRGYYDYAPGAANPAPKLARPAPPPTSVVVRGTLGAAEPLIARAQGAGFSVTYVAGPSALVFDGHAVAPTDGRPAALRYAEDLGRPAALFDHARDFASTKRLALARAPQGDPAALVAATGFLQALGIEVSVVGDSPGLIVLRTLAMTANEAFAALEAGVCAPADLDLAMQKGTNWPEGPLAWAARVGLSTVLETMDRLSASFGSDRYRAAPLLRRAAQAGVGLKNALERFA